MRMIWFLLLLVPLHLLSGLLVSVIVQATTNLDVVTEQWIITPIYVLLATGLGTVVLDRFVVPEADKADAFTLKVFLGSLSWAAFLIWGKFLIIYLGVMTPVESDFISAAMLVFGTALLIQYWWTRRPD